MGNKQRSDLELDNSKFGVDSSIRYGVVRFWCVVWELRGEKEQCVFSGLRSYWEIKWVRRQSVRPHAH